MSLRIVNWKKSFLSTNLLSVNAITNSGREVLFKGNEVIISYMNKTVLKEHKLKNGLFQVNMKIDQTNKFFSKRRFYWRLVMEWICQQQI